ncbi:hypothetical protein LWI28_015482 [Acer negundo]|uniref:Uncharacterized protein n=1 Tax=Acer negundo TaxID=4023 RepID=A0AAD5IAJ9_ACENE|nr:hypothetical protein LWI28_015482 [Acer negundo]
MVLGSVLSKSPTCPPVPSSTTPTACFNLAEMAARLARMRGSHHLSRVDKVKYTDPHTTSSTDLPPRASLQSRGSSQDKVLSQFKAACPGGSLLAMSSMPLNVLVTKEDALLETNEEASLNPSISQDDLVKEVEASTEPVKEVKAPTEPGVSRVEDASIDPEVAGTGEVVATSTEGIDQVVRVEKEVDPSV